jgi:hypothetical protein
MRISLRAGALVAMLSLLLVLPVLASTRVIHRWIVASTPMPQFHRMLVAGMLDNYVTRQEFEDQLKKLLAKYGVEGVQSYMVLPPNNEMMEHELKQRIRESSLDSVLVIRPNVVGQDNKDAVSKASYVPPADSYTFWPYWNATYSDFYPANSSNNANTVVRLEFNLYSTNDDRLVWSGETNAIHSRDFEKLGNEYAEILVSRLHKDKIIIRQK